MWTVIDTPVDPLRIVAHDGAVTAIEFAPHTSPAAAHGDRDDAAPVLVAAATQLREYFAGERTAFDLPLALGGTDFQQQVWHELRQIPYGKTVTYGEIADRLTMGRGAARAVGRANARNPVPVIVPCHRVIGARGSLVGYTGGVDRMRTLLELEGVDLDAPASDRLT